MTIAAFLKNNRILAKKNPKITERAKMERIVAAYFKGEYRTVRDYAADFSKEHKPVDLYEMATGKKLESQS